MHGAVIYIPFSCMECICGFDDWLEGWLDADDMYYHFVKARIEFLHRRESISQTSTFLCRCPLGEDCALFILGGFGPVGAHSPGVLVLDSER